MISSIFVPIAVLGVLGFLAFAFFRRGSDGFELTARSLLRLYLYAASLAGIIVLAFGLASLTNAALASVFGPELVYGGSSYPTAIARPPCPPGAVGCIDPTAEQLALQREKQRGAELEQRERRLAEDLIRGITFAAFGAVFWGSHWGARRGLIGSEERGSPLRRGYLMFATVIFGLTTVISLPTGVYQALAGALLPVGQFGGYRQGADPLGLGVVSFIAWLIYLRLAVRELRTPA